MKEISSQTQIKNISLNPLPDYLICFSHLRWDFVFQRPQHILTRLAGTKKVFYIEEPEIADIKFPNYRYEARGLNITMVTPLLPQGLGADESLEVQKKLFAAFMSDVITGKYFFWYYTPMALGFSREYQPELTVFDCMDELSAFKFAPEKIKTLENELLGKADVVFTGGYSLYEAKKSRHPNIHPFPSSLDKEHFAQARVLKKPGPDAVKLGFYGVIDERFDIGLISRMSKLRPAWEFILVGPVVKIDPAMLPTGGNIHYPGPKSYDELPGLVAEWDIALIPFLLNESTRFISPTKTPEYLAAGLPVISTPIQDVINPYGKFGLVSVGSNADEFVALADYILNRNDRKEWLEQVDYFLAHDSWDMTCARMTEVLIRTMKSPTVVYNEMVQS